MHYFLKKIKMYLLYSTLPCPPVNIPLIALSVTQSSRYRNTQTTSIRVVNHITLVIRPPQNHVIATSGSGIQRTRACYFTSHFSRQLNRSSGFSLYVSFEVRSFRKALAQSYRLPSFLLRRSILLIKVATEPHPASFQSIFPTTFSGVKLPIVSSGCSRQSFHRGHTKNVCSAVSSSCPHDLQKGVRTLFKLYKDIRKYPCPVRNWVR